MTVAGCGLATVTLLVSSGTPAAAHAAVGADGAAELRPVALAAAFAVTALATGGAFVRRPSSGRMRIALMRASAIAVLATLPAARLAAWAVTVVATIAVGLLFAPSRDRIPVTLSTVLIGVVAAGAAGNVATIDRALDAAHVAAAALWIGAILDIACAWRCWPDDGRRAASRFTIPGATLLAIVVGTGTRAAAAHLGDSTLALGTGWGRTLALKLTLVVGAVALGIGVRRAWTPRIETAALSCVTALGLVLSGTSSPVPDVAAPGPMVERVAGGILLIAPLAPGRNTVVFSPTVERAATPIVSIDGQRVPLQPGHGTSGAASFGTVELAAGRHAVSLGGARVKQVTVGGAAPERVVSATVPFGTADDDCIQQLIGATLATTALTEAGSPARLEVRPGRRCRVGESDRPAERIDWQPAMTLAVAEFPDATVLTSQRQAARASFDEARASGDVVVLAPWLLDSDLLEQLAYEGESVLVATRRDPTDALAVDYRSAALAAELPATAAGLEGYVACLSAIGGKPSTPASPGVFTVARVAIMPDSLGGSHTMSGWAPGLATVRVAPSHNPAGVVPNS